jgi:hypothetical protein
MAWNNLRKHLADNWEVQINDITDDDVSYHTARRVIDSASEMGVFIAPEILADGTKSFIVRS